MEKFEGEPILPRPVFVRVTVHLKNIPLRIWSRAIAIKILEDFCEPVFIDDVCTDGPYRRAIYAMVDCHDGRMIPNLIMVHAGGRWEQVFVVLIDWTFQGHHPV
jgi:hypothetical protein